jgi:hypothetical protein
MRFSSVISINFSILGENFVKILTSQIWKKKNYYMIIFL